jgi:hypothetical protein
MPFNQQGKAATMPRRIKEPVFNGPDVRWPEVQRWESTMAYLIGMQDTGRVNLF